MKNNMSLETLKGHLFETLEGLKNLSDPEASENEKVGIDQAKQIVDVSGAMMADMGIVEENNIKMLDV